MTGYKREPEFEYQDREWVMEARCRGTSNPDLWFPSENEFNADRRGRPGNIRDWGWSIKLAKVVCMECPVRHQCLEEALAHHEEFGIWGGLTVNQRRKILKGTA